MHAHWDHMLNIDLFKNSKVLMNDVERQYIKKIDTHDWATMSYASSVIESMQAQSVSDGEEIDDGVTMLRRAASGSPNTRRGMPETIDSVLGKASPQIADVPSLPRTSRAALPRLWPGVASMVTPSSISSPSLTDCACIDSMTLEA